MTRPAPWTEEQIQILRELYPRAVPVEAIAAELQSRLAITRTPIAVRVMAVAMGLRRDERRYRWTRDMEDFVTSRWGSIFADEITGRLNSRFGTSFTEGAVLSKAEELGLSHADAQGDLTQKDAAAVIGIGRSRMSELVRTGQVKAYGRGKVRYVPDEEVQRLKAIYAPPPEPTLSTIEAGRRLGYTGEYVRRLCLAGRIPGWCHKGNWRIAVTTVNAILADRQTLERKPA